MAPVPAAYHGVWKRSLLKTKTGLHDDTTQVFWLQTDILFADLRLPILQSSDKNVRHHGLQLKPLRVLQNPNKLHSYA